MPNGRSRRKGAVAEREVVNLHRAAGIAARRRQAPGLADNPDDPDVRIADMLTGEVKRRATNRGFKPVRDWLEGHDLLFLREDGKPWMVVMPLHWYLAFLSCWDDHGCPTDFAAPTLSERGT